MMSHFGHEAIFTLDYTINENQMFDCLMPGQHQHQRATQNPVSSRHGRMEGTTSNVLQFCQSAIPVGVAWNGDGDGCGWFAEHFNYLYACLSLWRGPHVCTCDTRIDVSWEAGGG